MGSGALGPAFQGGQKQNGTQHVHEEHKGQQYAHIRLKLEWRKNPGDDTYGKRNAGKYDSATRYI